MKPLFDHLPTEERLRRVLAHGPAVIYTAQAGNGGAPTYVSPNVEAVLGYPSEAFVEHPELWLERIHPDDRPELESSMERLRSQGSATRLYRFHRPDDEPRWIQDEQTLVPSASGGREVLGFLLDVTERKQLEEQLLQSQKMEAVGRLAGGIAHDFNNLLTAITGYSEMLLQTIEEPQAREDLEEIHRAGKRAASLTRQLLAFSRRQVLQPRVLELEAVVLDMEKMLRRILGEDVELVTDLGSSVPRIRIDPGQLEQVIVNFAVNARDAMPGGGTLRLDTRRVELAEAMEMPGAVVPPGIYAVLRVADTGTGMDRETQSRIFEPFFTTKKKGAGTGLGLSTVYGIVKQSGGFIFVFSEPGQGTEFRIYLPEAEAERPEPAPSDVGLGMAAPSHETILIAEDDERVRNLIVRTLSAQGYRVVEAASGAEALAACRELGPDLALVLSDIVMPDMRGPEVARRAREEGVRARFLFMSGYSDFEPNQKVSGGPPSEPMELVAKPFTPREIVQRVREVLDRGDQG